MLFPCLLPADFARRMDERICVVFIAPVETREIFVDRVRSSVFVTSIRKDDAKSVSNSSLQYANCFNDSLT